jgi:hypothetical protein
MRVTPHCAPVSSAVAFMGRDSGTPVAQPQTILKFFIQNPNFIERKRQIKFPWLTHQLRHEVGKVEKP